MQNAAVRHQRRRSAPPPRPGISVPPAARDGASRRPSLARPPSPPSAPSTYGAGPTATADEADGSGGGDLLGSRAFGGARVRPGFALGSETGARASATLDLADQHVEADLAAGRLGKELLVLQCNKKGCKRFYHPECLGTVHTDLNKIPQDFECPLHECFSCKKKGREVAEGNEITIRTRGGKGTGMNLVQCRRCPKAYHRKCLPRRGLSSRKWEIDDDRILFYCWDHKIVKRLRSATRDHLKFPEIGAENGTSSQGASKKRSVPEGEGDHANKESDPVSENRDKIPKTREGNPTPEEAETSQSTLEKGSLS